MEAHRANYRWHLAHPLHKQPQERFVVYRMGAAGARVDLYKSYPHSETVCVFVNGYLAENYPMADLLTLLASWNTRFPAAHTLWIHDHSWSSRELFYARPSGDYSYALVPPAVAQGVCGFGFNRMSCIHLSFVTFSLESLCYLVKNTSAKALSFDRLRLQKNDYARLHTDKIFFALNVAKLTVKKMEEVLVAPLLCGFVEQDSFFLDIECGCISDSIWRKVRDNFSRVRILQLTGQRLFPGLSFDDLIYRQGDYNRLVDLRLCNVNVAIAEYPTFLEAIRQSGDLRHFSLEGWSAPSCGTPREEHAHVEELYDALSASTVTKIHFESVPFYFLIVMEQRLPTLHLNDIYVQTLRLDPHHFMNHPGICGEFAQAMVFQLQYNTFIGAIESEEDRLYAEERNGGFHLKVQASSLFSAHMTEQIREKCQQNRDAAFHQPDDEEEQHPGPVDPMVEPVDIGGAGLHVIMDEDLWDQQNPRAASNHRVVTQELDTTEEFEDSDLEMELETTQWSPPGDDH
jgi:hypothetical protein